MQKKPKLTKKGVGCAVVIGIVLGSILGVHILRDDKKDVKKEPNSVQYVNSNPHSEEFRKEFNGATIGYDAKDKRLNITYKAAEQPSETWIVRDFAVRSTDDLARLKNNTYVNTINFYKYVNMTDLKGNKRPETALRATFKKDNYKGINFKNWKDQVLLDPSIFYRVSDGYFITPGIFTEVDPELKNKIEVFSR